MPRYTFSLAKAGMAADAGAVLSDSFTEALDAIARQPRVSVGDVLEIGVPGFPPARYECVATGNDGRQFRPTNLLAA
jgi:hypothetical protein